MVYVQFFYACIKFLKYIFVCMYLVVLLSIEVYPFCF